MACDDLELTERQIDQIIEILSLAGAKMALRFKGVSLGEADEEIKTLLPDMQRFMREKLTEHAEIVLEKKPRKKSLRKSGVDRIQPKDFVL